MFSGQKGVFFYHEAHEELRKNRDFNRFPFGGSSFVGQTPLWPKAFIALGLPAEKQTAPSVLQSRSPLFDFLSVLIGVNQCPKNRIQNTEFENLLKNLRNLRPSAVNY